MSQSLEGNKEVCCVTKEKKKNTHFTSTIKKGLSPKIKVLVKNFLSGTNFKTSVLKENQRFYMLFFFFSLEASKWNNCKVTDTKGFTTLLKAFTYHETHTIQWHLPVWRLRFLESGYNTKTVKFFFAVSRLSGILKLIIFWNTHLYAI